MKRLQHRRPACGHSGAVIGGAALITDGSSGSRSPTYSSTYDQTEGTRSPVVPRELVPLVFATRAIQPFSRHGEPEDSTPASPPSEAGAAVTTSGHPHESTKTYGACAPRDKDATLQRDTMVLENEQPSAAEQDLVLRRRKPALRSAQSTAGRE